MRHLNRIRAILIIFIILFNMLMISGINYSDKSLVKTIDENLISTDSYYKKYSGVKITLSQEKTTIYGLFGTLEITPFILQPSEDFIMNQTGYDQIIDEFKSSSQWLFKNITLEELKSLFMSAGINSTECNVLIENTTEIKKGEEYLTKPDDFFFWTLSPKIKAKLYPLIGYYSENIMYNQPLYFCSEDSKEWLYNSSLNEEIKGKILSLIYENNGISYLSDVHLILPYLKSFDDRIEFLKTVYRSKSMDINLVIKEGQNVSNIIKYWGTLGRTSNIEPLLKNLSSRTGGGKIDINKLLPTIPQNRLNTFCGYDEYTADWKDCHWTTINFFNDRVDERYYDKPDLLPFIGDISKQFKDGSKLKFGDIICIFDENNELVHSCTYIADNLALTKNGMGNLKPFIIADLNKTISVYGAKVKYLTRTAADTNSVD